jgi:hypothetical protein
MRRFGLGVVVATLGAPEVLGNLEVSPSELVERHASGDWGDIPLEDVLENEYSLKYGFRVFSSYPLPNGERIWILTEADRSSTCLILPREY